MLSRNDIVVRARGKYIKTGATKNITIAVQMYLENDASKDEIAVYNSETNDLARIRTILKTKRPNCKDCGNPLKLDFNVRDKEGKLFPTAFICSKCGLIRYLSQTLPELIRAFNDGN